MKVLIVEDEPLSYKHLSSLLRHTHHKIEICGRLSSVQAAVDWFKTYPPPDLVFMDIQLSDGQCFEIFQQVDIDVPVIFTTAYDQYALEAFKVNSIDYLLKPISKEALEAGLAKFQRIRQHSSATDISENMAQLLSRIESLEKIQHHRQRFLVKQGLRLLSIEVKDIAWFHAEDKLCFLRTWKDQRFLIDYTLEELGNMLDPENFFRINRAYLVHIRAITQIHTHFNGKLLLQLQPPAEQNDVIVSKEKAPEFKQWLGK